MKTLVVALGGNALLQRGEALFVVVHFVPEGGVVVVVRAGGRQQHHRHRRQRLHECSFIHTYLYWYLRHKVQNELRLCKHLAKKMDTRTM